MKKKLLAIFLICGLITTSAYAGEYNCVRKFSRGVMNIMLGWVEIFRQPIKVNEESGDIAGAFYGVSKGFLCMFNRLGVGVYEILTFPVPSYYPVVEPEFIFSTDE